MRCELQQRRRRRRGGGAWRLMVTARRLKMELINNWKTPRGGDGGVGGGVLTADSCSCFLPILEMRLNVPAELLLFSS